MAQPTTQNPAPLTQMAPTPGVGATPGTLQGMRPSMAGIRQTPETAPAEPVLFDDIDPVLLARLYPEATAGGSGEARAKAMEAGAAARDAAMTLVAAQQEPVLLPSGEPIAAGPAYPVQQPAAPQHGQPPWATTR